MIDTSLMFDQAGDFPPDLEPTQIAENGGWHVSTSASYGRSLALLWRAKQMNPNGLNKSGLILGMGETQEEVLGTLADMRAVGIDIITIGQYLRPTARHRPIHRDEFAESKTFAEGIGIPHVESGPLVRSSYHA